MSMTLYVGTKYSPAQRSGAWVCQPEGVNQNTVRTGVVQDVTAAELELVSVIEALKHPREGACVLFTSSETFYSGISGKRDERHKAYWDEIEKIGKENEAAGKSGLRIQFVKHPDNKRGTRSATKQADELLQEHMSAASEMVGASEPAEASKPVEKPLLSVKAPEPVAATSLCEESGKVPVLATFFNETALEKLGAGAEPEAKTDEVSAQSSDVKSVSKPAQAESESSDELCYVLVHQDQLAVLQNALEMYARLGMGQLNELTMALTEGHIPFGEKVRKNQVKAKTREFDSKLAEAEKVIQLTDRSGIAVFDEGVTESAKIAWDMYQSLLDPDQAEGYEFAGPINHRLHIEK